MISISRVYRFESAHFLPHVPVGHKCGRMHGHSYELTVEVSGPIGADGWVMDFSEVDAVVSPVVARLDHQCLNDFLPNPTSELLATWFAAQLKSLPLVAISVSETPRSSARWTP